MRLAISLAAMCIGIMGCLFLMASLATNLKVNYANYSAGIAGFVLIGMTLIIALLIGILTELKKLNNKVK
jgi:hypothetical protein